MRIFVGIVSFGEKNERWLHQIISQYRSMPWKVTINIITNTPKNVADDVGVIVRHPPKDPRYFPFFLRELLAERHGEYDVYIGSEDDVAVSTRNVAAFIDVSRALGPSDVPGFLRYEIRGNGQAVHDMHTYFRWIPSSIRQIDSLVLVQYANLHSAVYMLTGDHLETAIQSGRFLEVHRPTRYYGVLEAATTHLYTKCGLRKWFPISRYRDFLLHHLPNTYWGRIGVSSDTFERYMKALAGAPESLSDDTFVPLVTGLPTARFDKRHFESTRLDLIRVVGDAASVLWVGSGEGRTEHELVRKGADVWVIPLDSVHAIALARSNMNVVAESFENILENGLAKRFDAIVIPEMLERMPDPVHTLRKFRRMLSSDGRVIVSSPNFGRWRGVAEHRLLWRDCVPLSRGVTFDTHHIHPADARMLRFWFAAANYTCTVRCVGGGMRRYRAISMGLLNGVICERLLAVGRPVV